VPFAPWVTDATESASPSGSVSLASTSIVTAVSRSVSAASSTARGAPFTSSTVIETVATLLSSLPSFAMNVNESAPA